MENKKRTSKSQIIAFALLSLLPVAVIILGIRALFRNLLFNLTVALTYIIVPVIIILLFALVSFLVKKRFVKILLSILIFALFIFSFFVAGIFGLFEKLSVYENEEVHTHYSENIECMPSLSEISQPATLEYYDYYSSTVAGFLTCESDTLICKYDKDKYLLQKELLDEKYVFQNDLLVAPEYSCEPVVEIDGYVFRALAVDEYELIYPKAIAFIATNDKENEILYMYFYDIELDYIESLEEFILNDCGFKHIR